MQIFATPKWQLLAEKTSCDVQIVNIGCIVTPRVYSRLIRIVGIPTSIFCDKVYGVLLSSSL